MEREEGSAFGYLCASGTHFTVGLWFRVLLVSLLEAGRGGSFPAAATGLSASPPALGRSAAACLEKPGLVSCRLNEPFSGLRASVGSARKSLQRDSGEVSASHRMSAAVLCLSPEAPLPNCPTSCQFRGAQFGGISSETLPCRANVPDYRKAASGPPTVVMRIKQGGLLRDRSTPVFGAQFK